MNAPVVKCSTCCRSIQFSGKNEMFEGVPDQTLTDIQFALCDAENCPEDPFDRGEETTS